VIRIVDDGVPLTVPEGYGWSVLRDLSRLVAIDASASTSVAIEATTVRFPVSRGDLPVDATSLLQLVDSDFEIAEGAVIVSRDRLRAVTEIAGAGVEQRSEARDRHGRVPSSESPLVAAGRERWPVVSAAAAKLREAVLHAAGRRQVVLVEPWPDGKRWCVSLTHDVDVLDWWPAFTGLRLLELARKGEVGRAARVVGAALGGFARNPASGGISRVLEVERRRQLAATWFVLCGTPTVATFKRGDLTYRPESRRARAVLEMIGDAEHEVGLHGSFETANVSGAFASQRARLLALVAGEVGGVRQHFLRMRPGLTQREMRHASFSYDATYGYSDRNGFRLGVADVVPGWDEATGATSGLEEVPLVWMDRAQSKYQGIEDPERWVEDALALATMCRDLGGLWVGLWHPNLTAPLGYPGALDAYEKLIDGLLAADPYVATAGTAVRWRRHRRSASITAMNGDSPQIAVASDSDFTISLTDASLRRIAFATR